MPRIHVLPPSVRNKIAAGEVIERPASVVKELIENAIDAGSAKIEIDVSRAGTRLIRVTDDGAGMDREDALLCLERYATSKISDERDLFALRTLGFRGEALSSIAAVSRMRIVTGQDPGPGTSIEVAGGEVLEVRDCPAKGTIIEVTDLFYNTPARRKFLKSQTTETFHVVDTVTKEALCHHERRFGLRMNGSEVLVLPRASSLRERILQVFGRDFLESITETSAEGEKISVTAFFGREHLSRQNRSGQWLFVNGRPCRDVSIAHAVCRAYAGIIPAERHPVFLIFLQCDPAMADFNVHPSKREVRFADGRSVSEFLFRAARDALSPRRDAVPPDGMHLDPVPALKGDAVSPCPTVYEAVAASTASLDTVSEPFTFYADHIPFVYIGETFVAMPSREGLTILDYHAAHERVNYERFLRKGGITSWRLLFPKQVHLQPAEYRVIIENLDALQEFAVDVEDFGHQTVLVRGIPEGLQGCDPDSLMGDVAAALLETDPADSDTARQGQGANMIEAARKRVAASLACHSSLRGKEIPSAEKLASLLRSLETADDPSHCPHGRPTRFVLTLQEIKKRFRK